jgi:hypothetical protein
LLHSSKSTTVCGGGCWCTWFHGERAEKGSGAAGSRALKQRLAQAGGAHAALVYDGDVAVGWCQYGAPEELPSIYHRKQVETSALYTVGVWMEA